MCGCGCVCVRVWVWVCLCAFEEKEDEETLSSLCAEKREKKMRERKLIK